MYQTLNCKHVSASSVRHTKSLFVIFSEKYDIFGKKNRDSEQTCFE